MMARVEGMPLAALRAGLPWDWASFGEWLGRLDGRIAVNAGFLVGHSTLRRLVMGERAVGGDGRRPRTWRPWWPRCTPRSTEGALGFSTSQVHTHNDGDGQPVPSRGGQPGRDGAAGRRRARRTRGPRVELIVAGLPQRVQRRGHRLPLDHVAAGRPAGQLERARRLGHEPRRRLEPAGRGYRRRRPRRHRRGADAAPHHAAAAELRARRHPRRPAGLARGVRAARATSAWRRSRTPRRAAAWTPARSPTRPGSCATSRCGTG